MKEDAKRLELVAYDNSDLIEGLSWILDQAIAGHIKGACFIVKHERFKHSIGVLGAYRDDPYCAMRAVNKLNHLINKYADEMEMHS